MALRGALGEKDGIVVHCGIGSFAASRIDGKSRFAGGWGPVLGDEVTVTRTFWLAIHEDIHEHAVLNKKTKEELDNTHALTAKLIAEIKAS